MTMDGTRICKCVACLRLLLIGLALGFVGIVDARPPMQIHSHNDYRQRVPFYQAYAQQVASIEADVHLHEGRLLVGHDVEDLCPEMSFEALYVEPLVTLFARNGGQAYQDSDRLLQLMVELKSASAPTLRAVTALLARWPEVFDPAVNPRAVRVVVTGRVPAPEKFGDYPLFIRFDGNWKADYTAEQLNRVALISCNFRNFSQWNGKGAIMPAEVKRLREAIDRAHEWGKPIRFWNAPEGITVYYTFYNLGIDYVNTDHPEDCAAFFRDFDNKNFRIGELGEDRSGVTGTHRLDQLTRDFTGYRNDRLQLPELVEVYRPACRNDAGRRATHPFPVRQVRRKRLVGRDCDSRGCGRCDVTGDHETGGLVLLDGDEVPGRILGIYASEDHTPAMLPVFAYGPKADRFCGVYLNTEIARWIRTVTE